MTPDVHATRETPRRWSLLAFFALAYGISWLIWAPLWLPPLGVRGLRVVPFHHALGALGPITARRSRSRTPPKQRCGAP